MSDRLLSKEFLKGTNGKCPKDANGNPFDPRIMELVRILARRAAEADYKALLVEHGELHNSKHLGGKE